MSRALDAPPSARAVLAALVDGPVKVFVAGGMGTGKSTALAAARDALRDRGLVVLTAPPGQGMPDSAALVIDDVHLLGDTDMSRLTALAGDPASTVVVAAEPRDQDPGLRALAIVMERQSARIILGPLSAEATSRLLADRSPNGGDLDLTMAVTAGIPFLVSAVLGTLPPSGDAVFDKAGMSQTVLFALIDRLRRLDEPHVETLLICSLSTDLGAADVAAALDVPVDRAQQLIDLARATGLIEPSHDPLFRQSVHRAAAQIAGAARHHELESELLRTQLAFSTLTPELALTLAEHGMRDERLAQPLRAHAATSADGPAARSRIYRAAVRAGAADMRPCLAETLVQAGDCTEAAALTDELLAAQDPAVRAAAVRVAAAVAAHDGRSAQAAELFSWLGPVSEATVSAAAVTAHLGVGDLTAARLAVSLPHTGPPTAAARAAQSLIEGLLGTVGSPTPEVAARLGQAVAADLPTPAMTDSPAALVTLAALHIGDAARAYSVIGRAVGSDDTMFARRHRLLQAWARMQGGQLAVAGAALDDDQPLHPRDALWATALRTAVARRAGDAGALYRHWHDALDVLAEFTMDLYSLLPLGELWIAAARLGQQDRVRPAVDRAFAILGALGNPPAWALPLHWAGIHAGIVANDPAAVTPHAQALAAAAAGSTFAAALAAAGRSWLRVLAGQVDGDDVVAAAAGLAGFGLVSDATRLAGQAALHARDPKLSALMLQVARDLKLGSADTTSEESAPAPRPRPLPTALSDREREVAELLVLGLPYRDIGARLFISAKTVEHHVARIRRRLGAESRSEMLSMLRTIMNTAG